MDEQEEKITLAAFLGSIWPRSLFMAELARRTPKTLREFMNRANNFVNVEDTLRALTAPREFELEQAEKISKEAIGNKGH